MSVQTTALVKYETDSGEVALSPQVVRQYLVSGQGTVSDQEVMLFLKLCQYQRLNPFLREAYLIKFGANPATMVTGKDVFTKRAAKHPACAGWEAGVVVRDEDGGVCERAGTLLVEGDVLLGGWARVHRKDWSVPLSNTVSLQEYARTNKEGQLQRNWATMPATMIRKVALVQALREAFPEAFQGLYAAEEMPVDSTALPEQPVTPPPAGGNGHSTANTTEPLSTQKQRNRLLELSRSLGLTPADMVAAIKDRCGKAGSKDLTDREASALIADMEARLQQAEDHAGLGTPVEGGNLFPGGEPR